MNSGYDASGIFVDGELIDIGSLGVGIGAGDGLTGTGYIMYSVQPIQERFTSNVPGGGNEATNLMAVTFDGSQWYYSDNSTTGLFAFTPAAGDRLLAAVDFSADTATSLEGQRFNVGGIEAGYDSGNLQYFANLYNGTFNNGEFQVTGAAGINAGPVEVDWVGSSETRTLEHKVSNGVYRVYLTMGSAGAHDSIQVSAEGNVVSSNISSQSGEYVYVGTGGASLTKDYFDVIVSDGSLSLEFSDLGGATSGWALNGMQLEKVGTIVDTSQTSFAYDLGGVYSKVEAGFDLITSSYEQGDIRFTGGTVDHRDRFTYHTLSDPRSEYRDFVFANGNRTLEHKVSNGTWRVTVAIADTTNNYSNVSITAEGETIASGMSTSLASGIVAYPTRAGASQTEASFDVDVTDGSLSIGLSGNWRLNMLKLEKVGGSSLEASSLGDSATGSTLTNGDLRSQSAMATRYWVGQGISPSSLRGLEFVVADLGGTTLAQADGNVITIDDDAAGHGWFIDRTRRTSDDIEGMDLLSVLAHELGHVLGEDHDHTEGSVMNDTLAANQRFSALDDYFASI